jgi:hypothetical protein
VTTDVRVVLLKLRAAAWRRFIVQHQKMLYETAKLNFKNLSVQNSVKDDLVTHRKLQM